MMPVITVAYLGSAVKPVGIVADACDTDEHIYIPHDLGKYQGRNFFQRKGLRISDSIPATGDIAASTGMRAIFGGVHSIKADLVCGQIKKRAGLICIDPILDRKRVV